MDYYAFWWPQSWCKPKFFSTILSTTWLHKMLLRIHKPPSHLDVIWALSDLYLRSWLDSRLLLNSSFALWLWQMCVRTSFHDEVVCSCKLILLCLIHTAIHDTILLAARKFWFWGWFRTPTLRWPIIMELRFISVQVSFALPTCKWLDWMDHPLIVLLHPGYYTTRNIR